MAPDRHDGVLYEAPTPTAPEPDARISAASRSFPRAGTAVGAGPSAAELETAYASASNQARSQLLRSRSASQRAASAMPQDAPASGGGRVMLTPRQLEILRMLSEGVGTNAIAEQLALAPVTVRNHVARILTALGAHSRLEAVARGRRLGLLER